MSDEDARTVLARAVAGDPAAFEAFIGPVLPAAVRLASMMLADRDAAEDAVQEAALKAWRRLDRFRPGAEPRPWFLAITANECRSARRSRWARVIRLPDLERRDAAAADGHGWDSRIDLARALDRLPARHLLVITLYYGLDLPIEEVAAAMRCSSGAARVRLHRAVKALRPALAGDERQ